MENLKHLNYKNESIETKYLNSLQRKRFLQLQNILLKLKFFLCNYKSEI